jgi:hypothetical protein
MNNELRKRNNNNINITEIDIFESTSDYENQKNIKSKINIKQIFYRIIKKILKKLGLYYLIEKSGESQKYKIIEYLNYKKDVIRLIILALFSLFTFLLIIYYWILYSPCFVSYNHFCKLDTNNTEDFLFRDSKERRYYYINDGLKYEDYCNMMYNNTHYYLKLVNLNDSIYEYEYTDSLHEKENDLINFNESFIPSSIKQIKSIETTTNDNNNTSQFENKKERYHGVSIFNYIKEKYDFESIYELLNINDDNFIMIEKSNILDSICLFDAHHIEFYEWINSLKDEKLYDVTEKELYNEKIHTRIFGNEGIWDISISSLIEKMDFLHNNKGKKCICSFEFGIYKNILSILDNKNQVNHIFNTTVTNKSKEQQLIYVDTPSNNLFSYYFSKKSIKVPLWVEIEYLDINMKQQKIIFEKQDAACISYCLNPNYQ